VSGVLHHHHHGEEVHTSPVLLKRGADAVAPILELMESRHQAVEKAVSEVDTATQAWRASAGPEHRDALADAIDRLFRGPLRADPRDHHPAAQH
jgi:hypothetical protein